MVKMDYSELVREIRGSFYLLYKLPVETFIGKWFSVWVKVFVAVLLLGLMALVFPHGKFINSIDEMMQVTIGTIFLYLNLVLYGLALATAPIPIVGRVFGFFTQVGLSIGFIIFSAMFGVSLGLIIPVYIYEQYTFPIASMYGLLMFSFAAGGYYLLAKFLDRREILRTFIGEELYDENKKQFTIIWCLSGLVLFALGAYHLNEYMTS